MHPDAIINQRPGPHFDGRWREDFKSQPRRRDGFQVSRLGEEEKHLIAGTRQPQFRGPYTLWHHTHTFEERDGGTLCTDRVRYRPRGGAFINWLFVRRDVERIFAYRQQRLREIFQGAPAQGGAA